MLGGGGGGSFACDRTKKKKKEKRKKKPSANFAADANIADSWLRAKSRDRKNAVLLVDANAAESERVVEDDWEQLGNTTACWCLQPVSIFWFSWFSVVDPGNSKSIPALGGTCETVTCLVAFYRPVLMRCVSIRWFSWIKCPITLCQREGRGFCQMKDVASEHKVRTFGRTPKSLNAWKHMHSTRGSTRSSHTQRTRPLVCCDSEFHDNHNHQTPIDLLSKYLGTRSFDWPRGNFCLARSPEYGERSGRLELFEKQRLCLPSLVSFFIVLSLAEANVLWREASSTDQPLAVR